MKSPAQMIADMSRIRDEIEAMMQEHEREVHGGNRCELNRESAVGYLAHCLGVRDTVAIGYAIRLYDQHCPNCEHVRN